MSIDLSALDVTFQVTGVDGVLGAFKAVDDAGAATATKQPGTVPFTTPGLAEMAAGVARATQLLDAMGITARSVATGVNAVSVADRDLTNAQSILAKSGLEVEAISRAEAVALREQAMAAKAAAAAMIEASRASNQFRSAPGVTFRGAEPPRAAPPVVFRSGGGSSGGSPPPEPSGPSPEEEAGIAETTSLYGGLAAQLLELIAVYAAYRAIRDAITAGGQFDATIESARLGIAAITQAYGTLTDAQGNVLTGQQALTAGLAIADDQLTKLQADAIRVAIPFATLADLFRGIEGAALHAGASLDQIRQLVASAALAATALGTPYEQLNTTLVQLLEGHVRITNQLVAHLGLSNQIVHQWEQQGTLIPNLLATFQKFNGIGQEVQGTWRGISAEIKNAFDIITGTAIRPALTILEQGLRDALGQIVNLDTGHLSDSLSGLVTMVGDGLAGAAQLVVDAIQAAVRGAQELSTWFTANRDRAEALGKDALGIVESIGAILADTIKLAVSFEEWYQSSLLAQATWKAIADAVGFVADHLGAFAVGGAAVIGIRALSNALTPAIAAMGVAGIGAGDLGAALVSLINPVTGVIAVLGGLYLAIEAINSSNDEAVRKQTAARQTAITQTQNVAELTGEYRQLATEIASGKLTDDQKKAAQQALLSVTKQLIAISPEYQSATSAETGDVKAQADEVERLTAARIADLQAKADAAKASVDALTAQQKSLTALRDELGAQGADMEAYQGTQRELDRTTKQLDSATTAYYALIQAVDQARRLETQPTKTPAIVNPNPPPPAADTKDVAARVAAAIEAAKSAAALAKQYLDSALADNEVSYRDYFDELTRTEIASLDKQIAAKQQLLASAKPAEQPKIQADIDALEAQRMTTRLENERKYQQAIEQTNAQVLRYVAEQQKASGDEFTARLGAIGKEALAYEAALAREGVADDERRARVQAFVQAETEAAQAADLQKTIETQLSQVEQTRALIHTELRDRIISQAQATAQLGALQSGNLAQITQELNALDAIAKLLKDPKLTNAVITLRLRLLNEDGKELTDMEQLQRSFAQSVGKAIADGVGQGFAEAFKTGSIAKGFAAFGAAMLGGLGAAMVQFGEAALVQASFMQTLLASLASLNPAAAVAISLAMIAVGEALQAAAASAFGGGGSGGSVGAAGVGGPQTINIALPGGVGPGNVPATQPLPRMQPSASLGSVLPQPAAALPASGSLAMAGPPINFQFVSMAATWDAATQHQVMKNVRLAMRRGL